MRKPTMNTAIALTIAFLLAAVLTRACYLRFVCGLGWARWTGFGEVTHSAGIVYPAKTLWDWMDLLIVPLTLVVLAYVLNMWQRQHDHSIAEDNERQSMLTSYLEQMTSLILSCKLTETREARAVARTQTWRVLMRLDGGRKSELLQFLYDANLINKPSAIELSGADFTEADLKGATLRGAKLNGINATGADLTKASLVEADLGGIVINQAKLSEADLTGADLKLACLRGADLRQADLTAANLWGADLTGALCEDDQLGAAACLLYATMPDGMKYEQPISDERGR